MNPTSEWVGPQQNGRSAVVSLKKKQKGEAGKDGSEDDQKLSCTDSDTWVGHDTCPTQGFVVLLKMATRWHRNINFIKDK
jgi:hypothetical protein